MEKSIIREKIKEIRKRYSLKVSVTADLIIATIKEIYPGSVLSSDFKYTNALDKFTVVCEKKHQFYTCWNYIQMSQWCPDCAKEIKEKKIKDFINKKHGKLSNTWEYINVYTKFTVTCEENHVWETSWHNIYSKKRWCPYCAKNKLDESYVITFITNKGGLLEKDFIYKNSTTKFYVTCKNGHRFETYWSNIHSGHWCPYCTNKVIDENYVRDSIHKKGGHLEDNWRYINSVTKFFVTCKNNHKFVTAWNRVQDGKWCPVCAGSVVYDKDIKKFIKDKGATYDSGWNYENSAKKFWITCKRDHRFKTDWGKIQQGRWCPYCSGKRVEEKFIIGFIKNKGGILDSDWKYDKSDSKFWITCQKGHRFQTCWEMVRPGYWCPYCLNKTQEEFREVIEKFFKKRFYTVKPKWLLNRRGNRLHIDGYNEELKIAFEYQGFQHYNLAHFDKYDYHKFETRKENDADKEKACIKNNIKLIIVPYYVPKTEWIRLIKENVS